MIPVIMFYWKWFYVGWDFGDHHYDNFKLILNYNFIDQISFLNHFLLFVFAFFQCFFVYLYLVVNLFNESNFR
jgi:hypothetical protein